MEISNKAKEIKPSSTLEITAQAKKMKKEGKDIISFGAGEPDFSTPENICEAAINAIKEDFTKYTPASGIVELKEAICEKYKKFNNIEYNPNQIVVSNGGKHALTNIFNCILNPGDEVVIPAPYWLSYPEIVKLCFGKPVFVYTEETNNFKITKEQFENAITDKTKAIILNTPNNPTGSVYSKQELLELAEVALKNNIWIISDEIYEYLSYEKEHVSIASLSEEIKNITITCSGVSKSYAMTGWRIGYTASNEVVAKAMSNIQSHTTSNPNSVAQKAALEAISGKQDKLYEMKEEFDKRRNFMYNIIKDMNYIKATKPEGAFYIFIDFSKIVGKKYNGETLESISQVAKILLNDYLIAVIPCTDFGFPNHIRLSYAISEDKIEKGMARLNDFLNKIED